MANMTFKEFLAEDQPFYSSYAGMPTSKVAMTNLEHLFAGVFDMPKTRFKIIPFLIDNAPTFRFKFEVKLRKSDDHALTGKLLQNFALKHFGERWKTVKVVSDVAIWNPGNGDAKALFSISVKGEKK